MAIATPFAGPNVPERPGRAALTPDGDDAGGRTGGRQDNAPLALRFTRHITHHGHTGPPAAGCCRRAWSGRAGEHGRQARVPWRSITWGIARATPTGARPGRARKPLA